MVSESVVSPILAVAALSLVFFVLVAMFVADLPFAGTLRALIYDHAQKAMFVIAAVCMGASLYYSLVADFTPCDFCWYQRIAMYPIAVLLLVAIATRSRLDSRYVVTLAGVGLALSVYHYQLELFPEQAKICSAVVSCTARFVEEFGFVSIPFMAGCGFLSILLLQVAEWRAGRYFEDGDQPDGGPE